MIYVITTFTKVSKDEHGFPCYGDVRPVAWYSDHDDAVRMVQLNNCDIWETIYDYAVVESLPEGMYPTTVRGYESEYFKYNQETEQYEPIDKSEIEFEGIQQCWSIG